MSAFDDREISFLHLPVDTIDQLRSPQNILLVYQPGYTLDVGALCYLQRASSIRTRNGGRKVVLSSIDETRSADVRLLIAHFSESFSGSGLRIKTVFGRHYAVSRFIDWCDANGHSAVLIDSITAHQAFRSYISHLRRLVDQNQLSIKTAGDYQELTRTVLEEFFEVDTITHGINLLSLSTYKAQSVAVPDDRAQERVLAWCKCLLTGLSHLVVDQRPYPFELAVPAYLDWPQNRIWIFPISQWCKTPDSPEFAGFQAYDYKNGRIRIRAEIEQLFGKANPYGAIRPARKAREYVDKSNADFSSGDRIERGMLAVSAFSLMFVASTGCNVAQAREMPWSDELEQSVLNPLVERQGFRTIKYRANNRLVSFEIGVEYMPYLRRYLQLRKYLLGGRPCDYLFFSYGQQHLGLETGPCQIGERIHAVLFSVLRRLTPTIPTVVPMQWRAAKQDYLISNHDPVTTARIMQHSPATTLRKYSNGSEVTQQTELSAFLRGMENIVLVRDEPVPGSESRSIGLCLSPNNPRPIVDHVPVMPDCKGPEGCLFCDHYRVHADETDVRKLLSARFCLRKTSHLAASPEQFLAVFGAMLSRIDFVLAEISRHDNALVQKIERAVDIDGELDPFWAGRYEMLAELDLV